MSTRLLTGKPSGGYAPSALSSDGGAFSGVRPDALIARQRDARSAYKIDRDAAGGVVDLVRLSGAKEHRFSRSDRPLWLAPPASSARRSAPSTGCEWKHLPPPPSARARACAAGFSRSAVAPSRFANGRVVPVPNHHTHSSGTLAFASRQRAAGAASTGCGSCDRIPPLLPLARPILHARSRLLTRNATERQRRSTGSAFVRCSSQGTHSLTFS